MLKSVRLAAALAALASSAAPAAAAVFTGSTTVGTRGASYSLTTDDTIGVLSSANILAWTVTLTAPGNSLSYSNLNGQLQLSGAALTSTGSELKFNYSDPGYAYALFWSPGHEYYFCLESNACTAYDAGRATIRYMGLGSERRTGNQVIATVLSAPVPEPATWAMMIAGFGLVGGAMRRRVTHPSYA